MRLTVEPYTGSEFAKPIIELLGKAPEWKNYGEKHQYTVEMKRKYEMTTLGGGDITGLLKIGL